MNILFWPKLHFLVYMATGQEIVTQLFVESYLCVCCVKIV